MPPVTSLAPAEAAARVGAVAAAARTHREGVATDRAVRVAGVAGLAQNWLEENASQVRRDLEVRIAEVERLGTIPSLFTIMGRPWLERPYNSVLAWICDPQADHGVGVRVMLRLAVVLNQPELAADLARDASAVKVLPEAWPLDHDGEGEPDLLIVAPSVFVLVENKVRAGESGEGQYEKYLRSLKRLADRHERGWAAFLVAPEHRDVPVCDGEPWTGTRTHAELAAAIRDVAGDPETSAWGRVLCLLVAEELAPARAASGSLRRARDLLRSTALVGGVRHVAEMRHLAAELTPAPTPWKEESR